MKGTSTAFINLCLCSFHNTNQNLYVLTYKHKNEQLDFY